MVESTVTDGLLLGLEDKGGPVLLYRGRGGRDDLV